MLFKLKFVVFHFNRLLEGLANLYLICEVNCVDRLLQALNLLDDVLTDVEQQKCALVSLGVTNVLLHDLGLVDHTCLMVIKFKPALLISIINKSVKVPIVSQPIVAYNSMQGVWLVFIHYVWLFKVLLQHLDILLELIDLISCKILVFSHCLGRKLHLFLLTAQDSLLLNFKLLAFGSVRGSSLRNYIFLHKILAIFKFLDYII